LQPRSLYERLWANLSEGDNVEAGHYMERSWLTTVGTRRTYTARPAQLVVYAASYATSVPTATIPTAPCRCSVPLRGHSTASWDVCVSAPLAGAIADHRIVCAYAAASEAVLAAVARKGWRPVRLSLRLWRNGGALARAVATTDATLVETGANVQRAASMSRDAIGLAAIEAHRLEPMASADFVAFLDTHVGALSVPLTFASMLHEIDAKLQDHSIVFIDHPTNRVPTSNLSSCTAALPHATTASLPSLTHVRRSNAIGDGVRDTWHAAYTRLTHCCGVAPFGHVHLALRYAMRDALADSRVGAHVAVSQLKFRANHTGRRCASWRQQTLPSDVTCDAAAGEWCTMWLTNRTEWSCAKWLEGRLASDGMHKHE